MGTQQQQQYQQKQQQGRGRGVGEDLRKTKTSKYYKTSKNVCQTHGYDVATNHNSANYCNKNLDMSIRTQVRIQ